MAFHEFPWVDYDQTFRQLRASSRNLPWGSIHVEIFLFCSEIRIRLPECPHTLCKGKDPVENSNNAVTVQRQTPHCPTVVATASPPVMEPISAKSPSAHLHSHPNNFKPTETTLTTNPLRNRKFKVPTPVQPHTLDTYIEGYDPTKRLTLVGFESGFVYLSHQQ